MLFLIYIYNKLNIYKKGVVKKYIKSLTLKEFLKYIKNIYIISFNFKVNYKANKLIFL